MMWKELRLFVCFTQLIPLSITRPWDSRMWIALAGNFEKLKRDLEAIKSYKRALLGLDENDLAGPTLFCLGGLYDKLSVSSSKSNQRDKSSAMASTHRDSAAFYFKLAVAEGIAKQSVSIGWRGELKIKSSLTTPFQTNSSHRKKWIMDIYIWAPISRTRGNFQRPRCFYGQ